MTKETSLWTWIRKAKLHYGSRLFLQRIESGNVEPGIPDMFVCCDGISFWIEGKTTSDLSSDQHEWHRKHVKAGGISFILFKDKKTNEIKFYRFGTIKIIFALSSELAVEFMKHETEIETQRLLG